MSGLDYFARRSRRMVTQIGRRTYRQANLNDYTVEAEIKAKQLRPVEPDLNKANLVGSEVPTGLHAPALDIDFQAHLEPSSTPGHYHLYLDRLMSWDVYEKLLKALAEADIISQGYLKFSLERKQTFLRLPGETKGDTDDDPF